MFSFFSLWEFSQEMLTCTILSQNGEGPDPFYGMIYPISMLTMDRGRFSNHFRISADKMCFSFSRLWEFSEKMLTCTILPPNGEGPVPIFFVIYPQQIGVDFPATSFYPRIKCVFPSSVCETFLKKCWRAQFYLNMVKVLTQFFRWFILSISTPTMDRGRFSSHFRLSVDKCVFLLQSVRVLSKNADVHNFIWKWRRPRPFLWGDLSFQFQCPQWTGVNFPPTSFYPSIKCVFPIQYVRVFSNNADVHNFI